MTCFMIGSAAGSFVIGRAADRAASPLLLFGLSQIGVSLVGGITCAAAASGGLARPLLLHFVPEPGGVSFNLTLVLTYGVVSTSAAFLAGGSLPLLVKCIGTDRSLTRRAGILASTQAAGAAVGAILCGFFLLPAAGLRLSLLGLTGVTALTGVAAIVAAPRFLRGPRLPVLHQPVRPTTGGSFRSGWPAPLALVVAGMALTMLEVAWTRLATLSFGSSAQATSAVLALVIASLAVGYRAGAGRAARSRRPGEALAWLLAIAAASILAGDAVFGRLPVLVTWIDTLVETGTASYWWQVSMARLGLLLLPLGLPSLMLGAVYPFALRVFSPPGDSTDRDGTITGLASCLSAIGTVAGPPLAWFGLIGAVGSRGTLMAPAVALLVSASLVALGYKREVHGKSAIAVCLVTLTVLTAALNVWLPWDPYLASSGPYVYASYYATAMERSGAGLADAVRQRGTIIFSHEGADALVTVRRSGAGLLSLQVNGKTDASTGGDLKTQALTAHLPLLAFPAGFNTAPRVLVVGLGSGVTAAAALSHAVGQVDVIEISPGVVAALPFFSDTVGDLGADPRFNLVTADARTHLLFAAAGGLKYDIIASQPSNPWIAGQAILFTREFFELAASRLTPGGIMCQWLQGQGLPAEDFRSILATFARVFPHVSIWEESTAGGDYLLIGSREPLRIDEEELGTRMRAPRVARDLARIEIRTAADLLEHLIASGPRLERLLEGAVIQSEDRVSLEFTAPSALHRETLGEILTMLEPARGASAEMLVTSFALSDELERRRRSARRERQWAAGLGLLAPSLQLDPDLVRAASYLDAGMREHALEAIRALALRSPSQRTPHLMTAHLLMSMPGERTAREIAEVVRELRTAVALDPSEPQARLYLSRALHVAGAIDEALVENGAVPDPRPPEADSDRCAMFLELGDGASAEAACIEAIARDPGLAAAHANLGVARSRRARLREAESSYLRALELEPGLLDTRYNLAALYERSGRHREGLELLRGVVSPPAPGTDAGIYLLAARLAVSAGDIDLARACLAERLARDPADAETIEIGRSIADARSGTGRRR